MDAICRAAAEPGAVEPFEDALSVLPELIESDEVAGVAYARHLREAAMDRVVELGGDVAAAERCVRAAEGMLRLCAPLDFDSYCLFMEWRRPPEKRFYAPRRHVLFRKVVRHLQALADGLIVFLSISLPPRVGKSTLCIFFLTWLMGRDPLSANLMSGHSDKLTKGFHQEALDIITSPEYRFGEVFPDAPFVDKSYADETISLKRKSRFPTLTCRSVDGTLTGAVEVGRSGLLYCDDLVSDREEALSSERMEKLYSAYLNQLRDRKLDGARELHVGTRWAPNDPIGRIRRTTRATRATASSACRRSAPTGRRSSTTCTAWASRPPTTRTCATRSSPRARATAGRRSTWAIPCGWAASRSRAGTC